jgi:beta-lactam-binding protein with PASTA domain
MKQFVKTYIVLIPFVLVLGAAVITKFVNSPKPKKYRINVMDGATYHADSFRMYGNNLIFEADGKQVIVNTDYIITSELEKVPD